MKESENQKVAYLDTNTLHYIALYLNYAKNNNLYPLSEQTKCTALDYLDQSSDKELRKSLRRGLHTICYMSNHDLQIEYSIASEIELLFGRARGKAIENAAQEGIPDRMWSRLGEEQISRRLDISDLTEIRSRIDSLSCNLENLGIAILSRGRTRDVFELAKGIAGLVFMSVFDTIIYASVLVAHSDYLITTDGYFLKTINRIHNPAGRPAYEEIQRRLLALLGSDVSLPFAFTITADGEVKPPLPSSDADLR